jgi:hypothetical protein
MDVQDGGGVVVVAAALLAPALANPAFLLSLSPKPPITAVARALETFVETVDVAVRVRMGEEEDVVGVVVLEKS